jgi:molybdopterin-dependent oxidoreductase alpha subunit
VTFNPVREKGLESFVNPQNPLEMLTGSATPISTQYHQVRPGGDIAALTGLAKHVLDEDERTGGGVLDRDFIARNTSGFEAFAAAVRATTWEEIEREAGLTRAALQEAAEVYVAADRVIGIYGMGLTQHARGFDNIAAYVSLLLLRGNLGRRGAGISPVRGHSNVQGQRTVGISEKPELAPLDRLAAQFGFEPPRQKGMNTVEACEGLLAGEVQAFIGLGGNFLRAVPDSPAIEAAWTHLRLTVQVATKLNRSHLLCGEQAWLLPCLGRAEKDVQAGGPQVVAIEDSLSRIHGSRATHAPASENLLSEVAIVAGMAQATLPPNPKVDWSAWVSDYGAVRDAIEQTYPDQFHDFNKRLFTPGGFYRGNAAHEGVWKTDDGKAHFTPPAALSAVGYADEPGRLRLITLRSNDQFNTTIYGLSDRLRGVEGRRDVLLMPPAEIERHGLRPGQRVDLHGDAGDGAARKVADLEVVPFDLPEGCVAGYYPELNPLVPLWLHDAKSKTPAYKSVPVRVKASASA